MHCPEGYYWKAGWEDALASRNSLCDNQDWKSVTCGSANAINIGMVTRKIPDGVVPSTKESHNR